MERDVSNSRVAVLRCLCKSPFQDKEHGLGKRIHNATGKPGHIDGWRCTVCGDKKLR